MKKNYNSIGPLTSFSIVMFKSWLNSVFVVIVSIYWYFVDFLKCNFCKKQNIKNITIIIIITILQYNFEIPSWFHYDRSSVQILVIQSLQNVDAV